MRTRKLVSWALVAAAGAVAVAADHSVAVTTASDPYVVVQASSGAFNGSYSVPLSSITIINEPDMDIFFWQAPSAVPILDGSTVVATLVSMTVLSGRNTLPDGEVRYFIDIDYGVVAGNGGPGALPTTFNLFSPTLMFDTVLNATALTSATFGGSDQTSNGITLTPSGPGGFAYTSLYNGGTTYQSLFNGTLADPNGNSSVGTGGPANPVWNPIGPASSIQALFSFTVSAGDAAGGTSTFAVAPAPGAGVLLALGGILAGRRRR